MVRLITNISHTFVSVLIIVPLMLCTSAEGSERAERYKASGNIYYSQNKYAQAIAEFTKAINEDPDYLPAYYNRGLAYHDLNLFYKAIVDFDMVIMMNPNDKDAYLIRGLCFSKVNKLKLALEDLSKAADLGSRDAAKLLESGEITRRIELERGKQKRINSIINENQSQFNRVSEVLSIGNEFGGNTIMTTYSKGDPLYDGKDGIFKQIDFFDPKDHLSKTELFHTAPFIAHNDKNKTTIWYNAQSKITKKEFTYTGKMLNHTGVQYYDEQGVLKKETILDKHGQEVSSKSYR